MILSIIIPVYNVEEYIGACIMSCVNQDIPTSQYEIIVVNDGSTDTSLEIVRSLSEQYDNIRVFSYENRGLSIARNVGLSLARGEYVWFVDSDDRIQEQCLKTILNEASECDVVAFGYKEYEENVIIDEFQYPNSHMILTGLEFIVSVKSNFMHGAPFYMFRKEFLIRYDLKFYPGIYHEDTEFTPRMLSYAKHLYISSGKYYQRTVRSGSITHTYTPKRAYDILFVVERLNEHISTMKLMEEQRNAFLLLLPMLVNNSLNSISYNSKEEIRAYDKYFYKHKIYKYYFFPCSLKYFMEGLLMSIFKRCPVEVYMCVVRK